MAMRLPAFVAFAIMTMLCVARAATSSPPPESVDHAAAHGLAATLSRSPRGDGNFQYFLSVYRNGRTIFSSPGDRAGLIPRLERPAGAPHWFPLQTVRLIGIARLGGVPFVVIAEHNSAADCGSGTVGLVDPRGQVIAIENACDLDVRIEPDRLVLTGPYYGPDAPLVNPTIPHATANFTLRHGRIVEQPLYFSFRITPPD